MLPFSLRQARLQAACVLAFGALLAGCGSSSGSSSSAGSSSNAQTTTAAAANSNSATGTGATATTQNQPLGFEGVPIESGPDLASASTTGTSTVDGISCGPTEQLAYHIHAHLLVYVDGHPRALPGGIGIPGSVVEPTTEGPVAAGGQCIYWLHTHAPDGIIHIESPTQRIYTLGTFFDEWHQPLTSTDVAGARGPVTAIVNGHAWHGSPRAIPLDPHAEIQLDVGHPDPPFQPISWAATQL